MSEAKKNNMLNDEPTHGQPQEVGPSQPAPPHLLGAKTEDAFNLDSMRRKPGSTKSVTTIRMQTNIPVDKPGKQEFFYIHPEWMLDTYTLKYEADGFTYLVQPDVANALPPGMVKPVTLYFWIDRSGTYGLWPAGLPLDDGTDYPAWQSVHRVCQIAKTQWVAISWNKGANGYDVKILKEGVAPDAPVWPDLALWQIVQQAFQGRVISDLNHVVLRRLRGEV